MGSLLFGPDGAAFSPSFCVIKMASVMSIHSSSLGSPILIEEAGAEAVAAAARPAGTTPACQRMKDIGQWNAAWGPFYQLDPQWTDAFMATGMGILSSRGPSGIGPCILACTEPIDADQGR